MYHDVVELSQEIVNSNSIDSARVHSCNSVLVVVVIILQMKTLNSKKNSQHLD